MRLDLLHRKTQAHDEGVWSTAWVPGRPQLLTGSVDESVKVWEDATDQLRMVHTYQGHTLGVVSVVVNGSGEYAASSSLDSMIRVWSLLDHSTKALIETAPTETWAISFGPQTDALHLATAGGTRSAVVLWRIGEDDTSMAGELPLPQAADEKDRAHKRERFVLSVAYSPDGRRLACGAMDGTVAVYDVQSLKQLGVLEGHHKPVRSLCFTPDSKMVLTGCDDMHVNLYDVENGQLVESFSGHESWVLDVAMHPSGTAFASGGSDAKVKLWDIGSRSCQQTVAEHTDQVWSVSFSSEGSRLATVSDDKSICTYSCS